MCWLYILKNDKTGRYYIGSTTNLARRLKQHRLGYIRTTKVLGTNMIVYTEKFDSINEARQREKN